MQEDKAGQAYWETLWTSGVGSHPPTATANDWRTYFDSALQNREPGSKLIEVGCANSPWLYYFSQECGFSISGLDYSPIGCRQTRELLDHAGVSGMIICADVFSPPADLLERSDVAVSFGLVEHFADTASVVHAIAQLVKPGGLVITAVPNLDGLVGAGQWMLDRNVLKKHVPLTPESLAAAHEKAGLRVVNARYVGPLDFHACNATLLDRGGLVGRAKDVIFRVLCKVSRSFWFVERKLMRLPQCRLISSHVFCTAIRP